MTTRAIDIDLRGLISNSLAEWEGRIATVVFTAGCNWRCAYCHGWRFIREPQALPRIEPQRVFDLIDKQADWLDGIAISGGEPTLQPGLLDFVRELAGRGMPVKLETNGSRPAVIEALLAENLLACLCLDYKAPLDGRLARLAGVADSEIAAVRKSFSLAAGSGVEREYHTTLCPAFIDAATMEEMAQALEPGGLWVLQQYEIAERLDPAAAGDLRYGLAELERLEQLARKAHARVLLRKGTGA